jgi:7-carboxy-7-deazaguanine synthase
MRVNEIFASIQGEGTRAGEPCTFVRFTGCNLRCTYCDTEYAFYEGEELARGAILDRVAAFGLPLVCVTGGEPMLQKEIVPFLEELVDRGHTVLLETGGSRSLAGVPEPVIRVVDIKTPGAIRRDAQPGFERSPEFLATFFAGNLDLLRQHDLVKLVLTSRADYDWSVGVMREHRLHERVERVLLSPSHGKLDPRDLVAWMVEDRLPARMNLQLHKYVWGADVKGV